VENLLWVLQIERHCQHFGKFGGEEDWKSFEAFVCREITWWVLSIGLPFV
jgi:hypothetical protein